MPAKLMRCVKAVKAKGVKNPWGICIASTGLKPHRSYSKRMVPKEEESFSDWCNRPNRYDKEASRIAAKKRMKELNAELKKTDEDQL